MEMRKSILVVDDDDGVRETMSDVLNVIGYDVDSASNGNEAVNMERSKHHDIILMDVRMPIMNGIDACKEIKKFDTTSRVVFITAYANNGDRQEMERIGCKMMEKPVNMTDLVLFMHD